MTTVYTVSKPCGCTITRTLDKAQAVAQVQARGLILDAITCRTEAAERKALTGDVVLSCDCDDGSSNVASIESEKREPLP